jgi:hypothetical protein
MKYFHFGFSVATEQFFVEIYNSTNNQQTMDTQNMKVYFTIHMSAIIWQVFTRQARESYIICDGEKQYQEQKQIQTNKGKMGSKKIQSINAIQCCARF